MGWDLEAQASHRSQAAAVHQLGHQMARGRQAADEAERSTSPTRLKGDEVLDWFSGEKALAALHEQGIPERQTAPLVPEDFD